MEFLNEGEKVILKDDAKTTFFGKGTLYLTSRRVVFVIMTGGLFSKAPDIKIDQQMSSIRSVSVPAKKTLQIQFEGSVEPTAITINDPEKWDAAIRSALTVSGSR
jgi:hypothetical protein